MLILIKAYLSKDTYRKYGILWNDLEISREILSLLNTVAELHDKFPEKEAIEIEEFELYFWSKGIARDKDTELYKAIFHELRNIQLDEAVVREALLNLKQRSIAGELANASFAVASGTSSLEDIRRIYERFDDVQNLEVEPNNFVTDDLETLYEQTIKSSGLRWRLQTLNKMVGSLRRGDFGFIFARPETGKTTFLASEVSYFASQSQRPILWFNNEEQGNKVMIRCYQAALGVQLHELMSNRSGNKQQYLETTGGNIRIFDSASIHKREVERLCRELEPACIIFDQIDKIKGFDDDREDLRLGAIYIWARELAKQYCPVIGVCQASGIAEGVKNLTMDHVANAKTAKQAEADWILGIGKSHNDDEEYVRYFSVCKNKLTGDEDTLPELRHGKAPVLIKPEVARYEDIL